MAAACAAVAFSPFSQTFADYLFHDETGDYTLTWPDCPTMVIPDNCIANKGMTLNEAKACLGDDTTGKWVVIERNTTEWRLGTLPAGIYRLSTYSSYSAAGGDMVVFIDRTANWIMGPRNLAGGYVFLSYSPLVSGTKPPAPTCNIYNDGCWDGVGVNNLLTNPLEFDWPNGFKVPGVTTRAQVMEQTGIARLKTARFPNGSDRVNKKRGKAIFIRTEGRRSDSILPPCARASRRMRYQPQPRPQPTAPPTID
jgi:hypothetical protein